MKKHRPRALVLAAGHGKRLRPLTAFIPKPLLPIRGKPVAGRTLEQLAAIGCEAAAVNLFHRGDQVRRELGDSYAGLPLCYSVEQELLGTLGALGPLREFLHGADLVLVINGDSLCNWPLRQILRRHVRSGADATLLVSKRVDPTPFGGGVGVDAHNKIVSFRPNGKDEARFHRRVFMGAHVLSPALLERVPKGKADFITDLYEPLLEEGGTIAAVTSARRWHDLGTPERYRRGVLDWGRRKGWVADDARVDREARLEKTVVEKGAQVERNCEVLESVILPEARIGQDSRVIESIVGPGVVLPPHTSVARRLVTTMRADAVSPNSASVLGGLVYEPI